MNRQGFTLIELLVVMALIGIVLMVLNTVFSGTLTATSTIQSRNEGINDLQSAQQLMAGKLREAWYVFPKNSGTLTFAAQATVTNPVTDTSAWNLNTHPILAMILPPESVGSCAASTPEACYNFYAYYPVKRSKATGALLTPDALAADAANDASVWTLMEYRRPYVVTGAPATTLADVPVTGTTVVGRVLADYIQPSTEANTYTMFSFVPTTGAVSAVTLNLRGKRAVGSQTIYLPSSTSVLSTAVSPRNLGK